MRYLTGKFDREPQKPPRNASGTPDPRGPNSVSGLDQVGEDPFRSEFYPNDAPLRRPYISQRIGLILVLVALAASSWFCFLGPGSSILELNLKKLALQASVPPVFTFAPTESLEITPSPEINAATTTPSQNTPRPTSTLRPSATQTLTATASVEPSPTPIPVQNTPTPTSEVAGCVPASVITLADVGKTLCVSGRVFRTIDKPSSFIIVVVEEPQAFYFVAYDLKYESLEKPQCIFATGEIRQLGDNPIMVLSYSIPLQYCP